MTRFARTLNADDKTLLAALLLIAGVKARIRKLPTSFRVCFDGSQDAVLDVLNGNGFIRADGSSFTRTAFNGGRNEIFVHRVAA